MENKQQKLCQDSDGNFSSKRVINFILTAILVAAATEILICSPFGIDLSNQSLLRDMLFVLPAAITGVSAACVVERRKNNNIG